MLIYSYKHPLDSTGSIQALQIMLYLSGDAKVMMVLRNEHQLTQKDRMMKYEA